MSGFDVLLPPSPIVSSPFGFKNLFPIFTNKSSIPFDDFADVFWNIALRLSAKSFASFSSTSSFSYKSSLFPAITSAIKI